jgi:hypothetical protein
MTEDLAQLDPKASKNRFTTDNGENGQIQWTVQDAGGYIISSRGYRDVKQHKHQVVTWVVTTGEPRHKDVWVLLCRTAELVYLGKALNRSSPEFESNRAELCNRAAVLIGAVEVKDLWSGLCGRLPWYKQAFVCKPTRSRKRLARASDKGTQERSSVVETGRPVLHKRYRVSMDPSLHASWPVQHATREDTAVPFELEARSLGLNEVDAGGGALEEMIARENLSC